MVLLRGRGCSGRPLIPRYFGTCSQGNRRCRLDCSFWCYYTSIVRSPGLPFPAPIGRGGLVRSTHTRKEWAREIILKKVTPQSRKRLWHLGITGHLWLASQALCTQPGANGQVSSQSRLPQRGCWGKSSSSEGSRFLPKHHRTGLAGMGTHHFPASSKIIISSIEKATSMAQNRWQSSKKQMETVSKTKWNVLKKNK